MDTSEKILHLISNVEDPVRPPSPKTPTSSERRRGEKDIFSASDIDDRIDSLEHEGSHQSMSDAHFEKVDSLTDDIVQMRDKIDRLEMKVFECTTTVDVITGKYEKLCQRHMDLLNEFKQFKEDTLNQDEANTTRMNQMESSSVNITNALIIAGNIDQDRFYTALKGGKLDPISTPKVDSRKAGPREFQVDLYSDKDDSDSFVRSSIFDSPPGVREDGKKKQLSLIDEEVPKFTQRKIRPEREKSFETRHIEKNLVVDAKERQEDISTSQKYAKRVIIDQDDEYDMSGF